MSHDAETIAIYDRKVADYLEMISDGWDDPSVAAFLARLSPGAAILDLGCGPGKTAAAFRKMGFQVDAVDASAEMVRLARERFDIPARQAAFADITGEDAYDAVWANFSLLHAPKANMPNHLAALHLALRKGGILHIGLKIGTGEARDSLGRFYAYYTREELEGLVQDAGFSLLDCQLGRGAGLSGEISDWIILTCHA